MSLALARDAVAPVLPARPVATSPELAIRGLAVAYGEAPPIFTDVGFSVGRGETGGADRRQRRRQVDAAQVLSRLRQPGCRRGRPVRPAGRGAEVARPAGAPRRHRLRRPEAQSRAAPLGALATSSTARLPRRPGPRRWLHGLAPKSVRERAFAALDMVGLADFALRRADALSGGQSQRVAIARALVCEPRMMLADEPAASLDPAAGEEVMAVFARVSRDTGTTLIFTTHHLDHALRYAERVIGLAGGRLAARRAGCLPRAGVAPWPLRLNPDRAARRSASCGHPRSPSSPMPRRRRGGLGGERRGVVLQRTRHRASGARRFLLPRLAAELRPLRLAVAGAGRDLPDGDHRHAGRASSCRCRWPSSRRAG